MREPTDDFTPIEQELLKSLPAGEAAEKPAAPVAGTDYSFVFDTAKDTWVCSVHGEVDFTAWVNCWNGCNEGFFDAYEDDPINCDPGEMETYRECGGKGGWRLCGHCNINNPDAEF